MPARDTYHNAVKNALIKDGWTITHDPLAVEIDGDRLYIDLGAEQVIAAEKGTRKIAVEIKTFGGPSQMTDMERALGQYILYRIFLRRIEPDRELYLAVPQDVLEDLFQRAPGQGFLEDEQGKVFGVDNEQEEIKKWLP
jgi:hypothetical protein